MLIKFECKECKKPEIVADWSRSAVEEICFACLYKPEIASFAKALFQRVS
jgi:hypothetical protein